MDEKVTGAVNEFVDLLIGSACKWFVVGVALTTTYTAVGVLQGVWH